VVLAQLDHPIVVAPMAGGPSTVALAAAVCGAGGLGFLASGYRDAAAMRSEIEALRALTSAPFGVNVFVPGAADVDERAVRAYVDSLGAGAGEPRFDDDDWSAKLDVLGSLDAAVPVVSFTFGCPPADVIARLTARGSEVWVTVTDVAEARTARAAGAAALVLQGAEAGGHRGSFSDGGGADDGRGLGLLALIRLVAAEVDLPLPLVAAGGVADGPALAAVLVAGAAAAQVGTAFLRAPEAGTHPAHAAALATEAPTALTRAFSGRLARGIENRFMREHSGAAPPAYPHVHHATTPLRAAARDRGDAGGFNLWSGQAHALAVERPAADTVRALSEGARAALRDAAARA
jgi:nitronate monooxygenase